jgi:hypothetical protein
MPWCRLAQAGQHRYVRYRSSYVAGRALIGRLGAPGPQSAARIWACAAPRILRQQSLSRPAAQAVVHRMIGRLRHLQPQAICSKMAFQSHSSNQICKSCGLTPTTGLIFGAALA